MIRLVFFIGFVFSFLNIALAQKAITKLSGVNKTYIGQTLKVLTYSDLISNNLIVLDSAIVDQQGFFEFQIPLEQTVFASLPLGIFLSVIYLEPRSDYEVVLPDFQPKSQVDFLNPFFKPVEIYLGLKNADTLDLNFQLANFNETYHNYLDNNYYYIVKNPLKANIDSVIETMEQPFISVNNTYFYNYRKYSYGWLKYITILRDSRYLIREYFNNQPIQYTNSAYMDLFNQVFANYLSFYSNTSEGQRVFSDIAYAKSPTYAYQTFENNMVLMNDTLQEMVLLKGLHDAFYSNDFPVQSMIITLDSMICCAKVSYHKEIAANIKKKVLQGKSGFQAPQFQLFNSKGIMRKNSDYLTHYVYLNFISIDSYTCREELELLKALYEKHKSDFKVVSISIDENITEVQKYFNEHGYVWDLLSFTNQKELIDLYKVKAFPSFYLINPEGNLVLSPANSPSENFEWYFFKLMQSNKRSQNR